MGRVRSHAPKLKAWLNALATGILVFLIWDVLTAAWEPIDGALGDKHFASALGNGAVMAAGIAVGLLGLVYFDRWVANRTKARAAAPALPGDRGEPVVAAISPAGTARTLSMLIAVGIGLHNFGEGLA